MADVWKATGDAIGEARSSGGPAMLVLKNIPRRFGHAATDRQAAYLSADEIAAASQNNPLAGACAQSVEAGVFTYPELLALLESMQAAARNAFDKAALEPKISSRQDLIDKTSQPLAAVPTPPSSPPTAAEAAATAGGKKPRLGDVMRKNMTRFFDGYLKEHPDGVYVGEDVEHGGYVALMTQPRRYYYYIHTGVYIYIYILLHI